MCSIRQHRCTVAYAIYELCCDSSPMGRSTLDYSRNNPSHLLLLLEDASVPHRHWFSVVLLVTYDSRPSYRTRRQFLFSLCRHC